MADNTATEELSNHVVKCAIDGLSSLLAVAGVRAGFYAALTKLGEATPAQVAKETGAVERYVKDWLINQTICKFVSYNAEKQVFYLTHAQKTVFAQDDNPFCRTGTIELLMAMSDSAIHKVPAELKAGKGIEWGAHHPALFEATERHFKIGYRAGMEEWLEKAVPSPMRDRMKRTDVDHPLIVVDVGCGHGFVSRFLAKQYPRHIFVGCDFHKPSIEEARKIALDEGLKNVFFHDCSSYSIAEPHEISGVAQCWKALAKDGSSLPKLYDIITAFHSIHDMCDPLAAVKNIRSRLSKEGVFIANEPMARTPIEANFTMVGQIFSAASLTVCTPCGLAGRTDGTTPSSENLGPLATNDKYEHLASQAGFAACRVVCESPDTRIFGFYC